MSYVEMKPFNVANPTKLSSLKHILFGCRKKFAGILGRLGNPINQNTFDRQTDTRSDKTAS